MSQEGRLGSLFYDEQIDYHVYTLEIRMASHSHEIHLTVFGIYPFPSYSSFYFGQLLMNLRISTSLSLYVADC